MNTYAQYSIKHCLDMLAPFESTDMEVQNGQWQFYQFMISIYQGMYEDQEKYMVFSEPYDKYIQKRQVIKKRKSILLIQEKVRSEILFSKLYSFMHFIFTI